MSFAIVDGYLGLPVPMLLGSTAALVCTSKIETRLPVVRARRARRYQVPIIMIGRTLPRACVARRMRQRSASAFDAPRTCLSTRTQGRAYVDSQL